MDGREMRRSVAAVVTPLSCTLTVVALAIVLLSPTPARATTYVSGRMSEDATWTAAGSPYVVTGDVELAHEARLTLEPGVVLLGQDRLFEVYGQLSAAGTSGQPVVVRDTHLRGRGIYLFPSTMETFTIDVRGADIDGGSLQGGGLSMYGTWSLRDSLVTNIDSEMYLWYPRDDCYIERNVFLNAGKISVGLHQANLYVTNNLFFRSSSESPHDACVENWAAFSGHEVVVALNTFMNPGTLAVSLPDWSSSGRLSAVNNYWSVPADDEVTIAQMIFDRNDNLSSPAFVSCAPALWSHATETPVDRLPLSVSVSLDSDTADPIYPAGSSFTVVVEDNRGAAARGVPAELYESSDNVVWNKAAESSTNALGVTHFAVNPPEPTYYRAVSTGIPDVYGAGESESILLVPKHAVSLALAPSGVRIVTGVSVSLAGSLVGPWASGLPDKDVVLQSSPDGLAWAPVAITRTSADGTYSFAVAPSRKTYYRVVFSGDARYVSAVSATSLITSLQPVHRFFNFKQGVHFYTASEEERTDVAARLSKFYRYEGIGYTLDLSNPSMNAPLYRFYNPKKGVHFYTASEAEKDDVIESLSQTYEYEGVAYKVSRLPEGGTPVYRFLNKRQGVHFYTASEAEKNDVISRLSTVYEFEGVAYYILD